MDSTSVSRRKETGLVSEFIPCLSAYITELAFRRGTLQGECNLISLEAYNISISRECWSCSPWEWRDPLRTLTVRVLKKLILSYGQVSNLEQNLGLYDTFEQNILLLRGLEEFVEHLNHNPVRLWFGKAKTNNSQFRTNSQWCEHQG